MSAHDYSFTTIDGKPLDLKDLAGKAVLVVNVASYCGFTPQYTDLQELHEEYGPKGLVVLGVPCNDFGHQESGSAKEIREFCDTSYHVTFPMTAKVEIIAAGKRHPFYQWVANELGETALPRWNFTKYLIGKDGALVEAFSPKDAPLGPNMLDAIKTALTA